MPELSTSNAFDRKVWAISLLRNRSAFLSDAHTSPDHQYDCKHILQYVAADPRFNLWYSDGQNRTEIVVAAAAGIASVGFAIPFTWTLQFKDREPCIRAIDGLTVAGTCR